MFGEISYSEAGQRVEGDEGVLAGHVGQRGQDNVACLRVRAEDELARTLCGSGKGELKSLSFVVLLEERRDSRVDLLRESLGERDIGGDRERLVRRRVVCRGDQPGDDIGGSHDEGRRESK